MIMLNKKNSLSLSLSLPSLNEYGDNISIYSFLTILALNLVKL